MITEEIRRVLAEDVLSRFLRYVQVWTTSDPTSQSCPSTERQLDLIRILERECREVGLVNVVVDDRGFLYATLPARDGVVGDSFGLLAHVDTSPDQSGEGVRPQLHKNWQGGPIRFPDDKDLVLDPNDSEELRHFIGDTIVTASGTTLLGADDKAGVAEIMSAMMMLAQFPSLPHPEITICFTHDEEVGRGVEGIDLKRLPKFCYTMDGGFPGELEDECFDALKIVLSVKGRGVHPGYAKGKMINAATVAARFVATLPEAQTPETTAGREGFFHVTSLRGDHERAEVEMILRDFDSHQNQARVLLLERQRELFLQRHPGLTLQLEVQQQYRNMKEFLKSCPFVTERAQRAIQAVGIPVIRRPIRGGTDGSRLSELGHPTPNIFAGGLMFHSRTEWVAHRALVQAAETILNLAKEWAR